MSSSELEKSYADLFRAYKKSMESVAPFEAGIEREGIYVPGREEVEQKYADFVRTGASPASQAAKDLVEAYIPYRDRAAQELRQKGFPDIQSGIDDFEQKTGVTDYSTGGFDGGVETWEYEQPMHELLSHQRPYDLGMAPDYRDFYAGTDPKGNPVIVKSNSVTPLNEQLAGGLDLARDIMLGGDKNLSLLFSPITGDKGFNEVMEESLEKPGVLDDASRELMPMRIELQYPVRFNEEAKNYLRGANELLKEKYMKPADQRLAGLLATQFPGVSTVSEISGGGTFRNVEDLLELVEQYEGKPTDRSKYFYGTLLPGVTPDNLANLAKDIRRTPSSLAPGVADLIPSAEAVRAGYEQGPGAMGKQMARDFVAGLPVSAALTPVLANPAVAPLAPGVGLGLIGSAAVEAADEAVRQETGEGITPKLRQFLGTRKRTGLADKPYKIPTEPKPIPTLGVAKPRSGLQKFRDEIQFRKDLAGERFNPRRGEFGLSELIFGR